VKVDLKQIERLETHAHSFFSNIRLLDSINRPKDLITTAAQLGLQGICLTDHECLCGAVEWLKLEQELKQKEIIPQNFKCCLGNEIYLVDERKPKQDYYHFILIAKDTIGFRQLCELSSKSWYNSYHDRGMERVPTLKKELKELINKNPGHLIATSACIGGEVGKTLLRLKNAEKNNEQEKISLEREQLNNFLLFCQDIFGSDFYLEVAPSTTKDQIYVNKRLIGIARAFGIKMIYGTDAHYLLKKDRFIHKAYLNSKEGEREIDEYYSFAHLMDNNEAYEYLSQSDYNENFFIELCNNSMEIYNKITTYDIFHNPIIPEVSVKDYPKKEKHFLKYPTLVELFNSNNIQERYWINQCWDKMCELGWDKKENYVQRLEVEADIIKTIGQKLNNCIFEYFNTFQHFIDLFWECGSIVGPGRGSSVCYLSNKLLGITQLNPIEWNLAEWRFLNKERTELPDIDVDLAPSKRPLILKKIRDERGEMRVLQVATFGTEGTKSAILTACRGYRSEEYPEGIDNDTAQYIASLVPQERGFLWSLDDCLYGDEEKGRQPIQAFIEELNKYPGLIEIIYGIDGLVNKRSQHASGVILYNNDPWLTNAIMKSPNGDLTTQFDLHNSEAVGDTKFDFLVTEICDKINNAIALLQKNGYFKDCTSSRQIYNKYFHPDVLNWKDEKIWDTLATGHVVDLFQFDSPVGGQAIQSIQPRNPLQLMMANALTRLTGEKGEERPIEKYVRFKNNIQLWYQECKQWNLTDDEIKILEPYYLPVSGVPTTQEKLMLLCMDQNLAHFTLAEANMARKICAKKQLNKIPELKEKFIAQCPRKEIGQYVWWSAIEPQMSYAFAEPHAIAYSFIAIQILALTTYYPIIYWNCACLITNSGGDEYQDTDTEPIVDENNDDDLEEEDEDEDDEEVILKKKKNKNTNYGKIATAIGNFQNYGIKILPPDINTSSFSFTPNEQTNSITYGLRGITRVSTEVIHAIIDNRPYKSLKDFMARVKLTKPQLVNLIKSGAFDEIEQRPREDIMHDYLEIIADKKQTVNLRNMQMLIEKELIPDEMKFYAQLFLFNKYLKTCKSGIYYNLNESAFNFIAKHFDANLTINGNQISQDTWDKLYKKNMEPMRLYLKEHCDEMLAALNKTLYEEVAEKYGTGNISKWEMESLSFYYHAHELAAASSHYDNFFELPEEPEIECVFPGKTSDKEITLFKLHYIIGAVIDKNKLKNTISLLTPDGVVQVKIYKNQYALFDKRISEVDADGKKKVIEESWFKKGTLLMIQGIRRDSNFIPKKYKKSPYPVISKIINMDDNGVLELQEERMEVGM